MKVTIVKSEKYGISSPSQVLFEVKKKRKSKTMQPCRRQWSNLEGKITSMCSERVLKHTRTKQEEPFHCTHTHTHTRRGAQDILYSRILNARHSGQLFVTQWRRQQWQQADILETWQWRALLRRSEGTLQSSEVSPPGCFVIFSTAIILVLALVCVWGVNLLSYSQRANTRASQANYPYNLRSRG